MALREQRTSLRTSEVGTYDFSEEEKDTFRSLVANIRATATGLLAAAGVNVLFLIIKQVRLDW